MPSDERGAVQRPAVAIDLTSEREVRGKGVGSLGPLLVWAVVFADLGTSIYYVPGILYQQLGGVASAFVLVTTVAFVAVALEHLEVAHRYPRGGGGVAAAVDAFGPRVGVVSGALMVSAYLLTIALSTVTAMHYLATINPFWPDRALVSSLVAILIIGGAQLVRAAHGGPAGAGGRAGGAGGARLAVRHRGQPAQPRGVRRDADRRAPPGPVEPQRPGHRVRRRLAGVLRAGVAGPAGAVGARAQGEGHPHRQRPAGGQRAGDRAGVHRGGGGGGPRRPDQAPPGRCWRRWPSATAAQR